MVVASAKGIENQIYNKRRVNKIVEHTKQGIGRAICLGFAKEQAKVIILDINEACVMKVVNEINKLGVQAEVIKTDVSDYQNVSENMAYIVDKFGRIDVLVNNEGIVDSRAFVDIAEKDWDRVISINLKGVFNTYHIVLLTIMGQKYGKIVNIASIAEKVGVGIFGNTVYSTSKAGVIALTKGLARGSGPYGVNVNAICTRPVNVSMIAEIYSG